MHPRICGAIVLVLSIFWAFGALAQDTTITYQGQLRDAAEPFTGTADLEFRLFDQLAGGSQVGPAQIRADWPVEDGLFQVELDFGLAAFTEQVRYLEIRVEGTVLTPRQAIRPSPMALFALGGNQGPAGPPGASPFVLDETTGAIEYLFDDQVIRFEPDTDEFDTSSPRIALGHANNVASALGAVVSGGGTAGSPNQASGEWTTIGGGRGNLARRFASTVGGGTSNSASGTRSTVVGGSVNTASGNWSIVGGGSGNTASGFDSNVGGGSSNTAVGDSSVVAGGDGNIASGGSSAVGGGEGNIASGDSSAIGGGIGNETGGHRSNIGGGKGNTASGFASTVGGGNENAASGFSSTVVGGDLNTASGTNSSVGGGVGNCAGGIISWAGGRGAKVRPGSGSGDPGNGCDGVSQSGDSNGDEGTFIWADSQNPDFVSSGPNQFLVRAAGGVGINTNSPQRQLHVKQQTNFNSSSGITLERSGSSSDQWALYVSTSNNFIFLANNTSRGLIDPDTGQYSALSDRRAKREIEPLESVLERFVQLRPSRYRMRHQDSDDALSIGLIAQHVDELFPEVVSRFEDEENHLGLRYDEITVLNTQALIELRAEKDAQIDALRTEVSSLRTQANQLQVLADRNAELEARLAVLEALLLDGPAMVGAGQ